MELYMDGWTLHHSCCLLCCRGVARQPLQVCELCEAQILDHIPRDPIGYAELGLDVEDLLGPILLADPAWNEVCDAPVLEAWEARLMESGHLFPREVSKKIHTRYEKQHTRRKVCDDDVPF